MIDIYEPLWAYVIGVVLGVCAGMLVMWAVLMG